MKNVGDVIVKLEPKTPDYERTKKKFKKVQFRWMNNILYVCIPIGDTSQVIAVAASLARVPHSH